MFLYGVDLADPEAYNMVIRIGHLSEDDAVDIIAGTVGLSSFQETVEYRAALADLALTSTVIRKMFVFPMLMSFPGTVGLRSRSRFRRNSNR